MQPNQKLTIHNMSQTNPCSRFRLANLQQCKPDNSFINRLRIIKTSIIYLGHLGLRFKYENTVQ